MLIKFKYLKIQIITKQLKNTLIWEKIKIIKTSLKITKKIQTRVL